MNRLRVRGARFCKPFAYPIFHEPFVSLEGRWSNAGVLRLIQIHCTTLSDLVWSKQTRSRRWVFLRRTIHKTTDNHLTTYVGNRWLESLLEKLERTKHSIIIWDLLSGTEITTPVLFSIIYLYAQVKWLNVAQGSRIH